MMKITEAPAKRGTSMPKTYEDGLREAMEIARSHERAYDQLAHAAKAGSDDEWMFISRMQAATNVSADIQAHLATMQEKNDAGH